MKALIVANVLWQLHKSRGSYDPKFVIDECAENDNGVTLTTHFNYSTLYISLYNPTFNKTMNTYNNKNLHFC